MLNLYTLNDKLSLLNGVKQDPEMERILATKKGRMVIACSMVSPVKFCNAPHKYVDDIYYVKINDNWLSPEEFEEHRKQIQLKIMQKNMQNCGLTEEDMNITEEKLLQWEKDV